MEAAILKIACGEGPPEDPIAVPEGNVRPFVAMHYRIPDGFPNPPPPAPLNGETGVRFVLTQAGMTMEQVTRFMGSEVINLEGLADVMESEIDGHIKILAKTTGARGGIILGLGVASQIKAVVTALHEQARIDGGVLDAYTISLPFLRIWRKERQATMIGDDKVTVTPPSGFQSKDWVSFKDGMVNYFRQTKGVRKIPLFYVIRDEARPIGELGFTEERMYKARHQGPEFEQDNARVYQQLVQAFRDTEGWAYVAEPQTRNFQNGKEAWQRLCHHYDGPHAVEKRVAMANQELKTLYYKSEASFPLEKYVTRLTDCFRILAQNGAPKSERDKMTQFLDNIQDPNGYLLTYIAKIKMDYRDKGFQQAADALMEAVSSTGQIQGRGAGATRKVAAVTTGSNESNGGGRNRLKKKQKRDGPRGPPSGPFSVTEKNGKKMCNGVDVTNSKRTFNKEEWMKLGGYVEELKKLRKVSAVTTDNSGEAASAGNGNRFGTGGQNA